MLSALALLIFLFAIPTACEPLDDRPDIILFMVDDLGYIEDERVLMRLPNVRTLLLREGLRFTQMIGETPLCTPGRANILSGQHTLRSGVVKNDGDLLDPRSTIAHALRESGYHTAFAGKYLNNYDGARRLPGWDHVALMENRKPTTFTIDGRRKEFAGRFKQDVLRTLAVDAVTAAPDGAPLFGWFSSSAPHRCRKSVDSVCFEPEVMDADRANPACAAIAPLRPRTYSLRKSRAEAPGRMPRWPEGWRLEGICESLLVVDRMIGQVVAEQANRGRPLYLIFVSDNGMAWGQFGFPGKQVPAATRVPFVVAGPGVKPGRSDALLSTIDIAPTIAELAGVRFREADGRSFLPTLGGPTRGGRAGVLEVMPSGRDQWTAIRTATWQYVRWAKGDRQLFDQRSNAPRSGDVARHYPQIVSELDRRLSRLISTSAGRRE